MLLFISTSTKSNNIPLYIHVEDAIIKKITNYDLESLIEICIMLHSLSYNPEQLLSLVQN